MAGEERYIRGVMDARATALFRRKWSPWRIFAWTMVALMGLCLTVAPNLAQDQERTALVLQIDGAIGPAMDDYLSRGIDEAQERNAALLVIRMDTPGGLDTSMRSMIRDILASSVPVATFVHPSGARAASAGTYILYASHVAAMAPGTNLGAATPVQIGGGGGLPFGQQDDGEENEDSGTNGEDGEADGGEDGDGEESPAAPQDAMEAKAINDAVAYIRGLAELRDRNADWAERAVREAVSLSSHAAAEQNVIDFVATSVSDLLEQSHGRTVTVAGNEVTLDTQGLVVENLEPGWRTRFLQVITNPNVALILMMIGIYGLIFEFLNPGALVPGTIGAICLLIGLYSMAILPVNYAGAGLMLLGLALMIAEAFAPSFGVMGLGGAVAFVLGATILMDPDVPGFQLAWPVVASVAIATLAFSLLVVQMAWTSHRRAVVSGREHMRGIQGSVLEWRKDGGYVFVQGERWRAVSSSPLRKGQTVRVKRMRGLTLEVEPDQAEMDES